MFTAWPEDDIELALAWQREKRLTCDGCGHPRDESTDPKNARTYQAEEVTCYACASIEYRQHAMQQEAADDSEALAGRRVYTTKGERRGRPQSRSKAGR